MGEAQRFSEALYGVPYMVRQAGNDALIVIRALSAGDARRSATRACARELGGDDWQIVDESITTCLTTVGGRPRLYEGRFTARRS